MRGVLNRALSVLIHSEDGGQIFDDIVGTAVARGAGLSGRRFDGESECLGVLLEIAQYAPFILGQLVVMAVRGWQEAEQTAFDEGPRFEEAPAPDRPAAAYRLRRNERLNDALGILRMHYGSRLVDTNAFALKAATYYQWLRQMPSCHDSDLLVKDLLDERAAFWSEVDLKLSRGRILEVSPASLELLSRPAGEFDWGLCANQFVNRAQFAYFGDVVRKSRDELRRLSGGGRRIVLEIESAVWKKGLALGLRTDGILA